MTWASRPAISKAGPPASINANTIVGYLSDAEGITTACFWSPSGGSYTAAAPLFGVADTRALAVNNLGQAVGSRQNYPTLFFMPS